MGGLQGHGYECWGHSPMVSQATSLPLGVRVVLPRKGVCDSVAVHRACLNSLSMRAKLNMSKLGCS